VQDGRTTANPVDDPAVAALLTPARLSTYLRATNGDQQQAMRLYSWNVEASAAMWGDFSVLEVCVRNAIGAQLEALAGRADWWNSPRVGLRVEQMQAVQRAAATLGHSGQHSSPGHVVANLTLGFWTSLLANRYHQRLWEPAIKKACPHLTGRRGALQQDLEALRRLRNRTAHHEPIFNRDLAADHQTVLKVLAMIEPLARDWLAHDSRIGTVLAARSDTVAGIRPTSF
jgi:hypothetical protein